MMCPFVSLNWESIHLVLPVPAGTLLRGDIHLFTRFQLIPKYKYKQPFKPEVSLQAPVPLGTVGGSRRQPIEKHGNEVVALLFKHRANLSSLLDVFFLMEVLQDICGQEFQRYLWPDGPQRSVRKHLFLCGNLSLSHEPGFMFDRPLKRLSSCLCHVMLMFIKGK